MVKPARIVVSFALVLGACQLPSDVLYRCDATNPCAADFACWPDGFCHPAVDGEPPRSDAGVSDAGSIDAGQVDAGGVDAGLDAGVDDAGVDAGELDAGLVDAGLPDSGQPCVPAAMCPLSANCGTFDAGCGFAFECGSCAAPEECGTQQPNVCALPKLCTRGFCWENPLPQGNTLFGAFAFGPRAVWAVGEAGTVLFWNGEKSALIDVGTTADLRGVGGSSPSDLYVVGEQGTIVHFDGVSWQRETTPGVYRINVIWVAPGGTAFAGANGGYILKRGPGGQWSEMSFNPSNTADIVGLAGLDTGEVYATSFARVYRLPSLGSNTWLGDTVWSQNRDSLSMSSLGSQLLAGGKHTGQNYGVLFERQSDAGWKQYGANVPTGFWAITQTLDAPFVATGAGGVTRLERDAGLINSSLSRDGGLYGLARVTDDTVFVAGEFGTMALVNDAGATELFWGGTSTVNGLCGYADARAYGAATNNVVYERRSSGNGVRWDSITRTAMNTRNWTACFADGPDKVWVVGDDRYFLRQSAGVFVQGDTNNGATWNGVWGSTSGPWYFINSSSQVYTTATGDMPGYSFNTNGVGQGIWGVSDTDFLIVTNSGLLKTRNSMDVTPPEFSRNLRAVHAQRFADAGVLYSVVGSGTTWRRVNGTFVIDPHDAGHTLRATWVTPQADIWATGDDGGSASQGKAVLWHYVSDGGWAQQTSPTTRPLNAMSGYGDTGPFIGGGGGVILRKLGADGG